MADYSDIVSLSNMQGPQSQFAGLQGANLADPFRNERTAYQEQLRNLLANPGSFASSPTYQFAYQQGLDNITNRLAGTGNFNSGGGARALMDYGQGAASQLFFPQANLLAMLSGATTGSPAAAAAAYTGGINRSQDQASIAAAAKNAQKNAPTQAQEPWWAAGMNQPTMAQSQGPQSYGLPSGGLYGGFAGQVDQNTPGYTPSANAGTGYVTSDYGTTTFGSNPPVYSSPPVNPLSQPSGFDYNAFEPNY